MKQLLKHIVVALLSWEAKKVLRKYKPFIIAVTGSVGKTSTKDAVFEVLKGTIASRKSMKSFNSELGVPLTVLGLENKWSSLFGWMINILRGFLMIVFPVPFPKLLVLEVGADHPGDIKRITSWLTPDITIVTRIPDLPVHVEYFSSPEQVKLEKAELVKALKQTGVFIANADDPAVVGLSSLTRAHMITYGFGETAMVRGTNPEIDYVERDGRMVPEGMKFEIDFHGESLPVRIRGILGAHVALPALAACAAGVARGVPLAKIITSLEVLETPRGRMRLIPGKSGSTIIDDSYNSSPVALAAALETLKQVKANHRIAVLGDMLELGKYSNTEHWDIGRALGTWVDELVTVGQRARGIAEGAKTAGLPEGKIHTFTNSQEAGEWLLLELKVGDVVLVKGSQGSGENMIRMERAVKELMTHPEDADKLLVRQEKEWFAQYK